MQSKTPESNSNSRRLLARMAKYIDYLKQAQGFVLDAGCGDGMAVEELRCQGIRAIGIDITPAKWEQTPVFVADGYSIPFNDNYFEAVGCFTVLEHLSEPEKFLAEMVRVLKPGGRCVVACPNMRGVLMSHPGHFLTHRGGIRQRMINLLAYLNLLFRNFFLGVDIRFEVVPLPDMTKIPKNASDYNAICATNFIAVKDTLRRLGLKISYVSAGLEYASNPIKQLAVTVVDRIPVLREMFGGMFIVGIKE